jgi:hypothetical protein
MKMALIILVVGGLLLGVEAVFACATCGLNKTFTPQMLLISSGFVLLPAGLVSFIAYRLWKDSQRRKKSEKQGLSS